jgi:hypothetical protein
MRTTITFAVVLWTVSATAQYMGAPARDVREAVRMLQETQRLIEPAIAAVADQAAVLNMLATAGRELKEAQPASSFDDANKIIDEFVRKRNENETLPRDLDRAIADARQILAINKPILNVTGAREQLHHSVMHPLERALLRSALDLQQLAQQLQSMQGRAVGPTLPQIYSALSNSATDAVAPR